MGGRFSRRFTRRMRGAFLTVAVTVGGFAFGSTSTAAATSDPGTNVGSAVLAGRVEMRAAKAVLQPHGADLFVSFAVPELGAGATPAADRAMLRRVRAAKRRLSGLLGSAVRHDFSELPVAKFHIADEAQLEIAAADADVAGVFVEENLEKMAFGQVDPYSPAVIRQPVTAAEGYKGAGAAVAVIDTGADYTQPAFGSCTAPNVPTSCRISFAKSYGVDDGIPDDDGHGTNVAGIVAQVAPDAKIWALDVFNRDADGNNFAPGQNILDALNDIKSWSEQHLGVRAVNMSLGTYFTYNLTLCNSPYEATFSSLRALGVVVSVAAGNNAVEDGVFVNGVQNPSCSGNVLTVGATWDHSYPGQQASFDFGGLAHSSQCTDHAPVVDMPTCFSQTGMLDLWAPGAMIESAGTRYSGTSQAAPHVAGAVAVLAAAKPAATFDDIRTALVSSGPLVIDNRFPNNQRYRRLDLYDSVHALVGTPVPPPTVTKPAAVPKGGATVSTTAVPYTVSWSGSSTSGIAQYYVLWTSDGKTWNPVTLSSATATAFTLNTAPGTWYRIAVIARDNAGNWGPNYSISDWFRSALPDELASGTSYSPSSLWYRSASTTALRGYYKWTRTYQATVTYTATGTGIAIVGLKCPSCGQAWLYVDGAYKGVIDFVAPSPIGAQTIKWVPFASSGPHTIKLVNVATSGRPAITIDGFVVKMTG